MIKKRATVIFLLILTSIALALCFIIFRPFLYPLISALIIGIVFAPIHKRVERVIRWRSLAAATSTLLVILVVAVPTAAILLALSHEISHLRGMIEQKSADSGGLGSYLQSVIETPMIWLSRYVDLSGFDLRATVLNKAKEMGAALVAGGATVLGGVTSFVLNSAISLFTLFFIFREGRSLRRRLAAILPLTTEQVEKLFNGIENTIVGTVYGGLVVAAVQGALVGVAFGLAGFESPVLWGVVASFFALLPLIGTAAVWVPAALYLLAVGRWVPCVLLVAYCALIVGTIDNILRPLLIKGRVEMHTLLIFFSVFGGVNVFGFLGLIIGPVILAVTKTLVEMLRDEGREWVSSLRQPPEPVAQLAQSEPRA